MFTGFFFTIFLFFLFIIVIGGSIIRGILSLLFGRNYSRQPFGHTEQTRHTSNQASSNYQTQQTRSSNDKKRKKMFDKSDGEYVDFEEIK